MSIYSIYSKIIKLLYDTLVQNRNLDPSLSSFSARKLCFSKNITDLIIPPLKKLSQLYNNDAVKIDTIRVFGSSLSGCTFARCVEAFY